MLTIIKIIDFIVNLILTIITLIASSALTAIGSVVLSVALLSASYFADPNAMAAYIQNHNMTPEMLLGVLTAIYLIFFALIFIAGVYRHLVSSARNTDLRFIDKIRGKLKEN